MRETLNELSSGWSVGWKKACTGFSEIDEWQEIGRKRGAFKADFESLIRGGKDIGERQVVKRLETIDEFEDDAPDGVDVARGAIAILHEHFRGNIAERANHGLGHGGFRESLGRVEITDSQARDA